MSDDNLPVVPAPESTPDDEPVSAPVAETPVPAETAPVEPEAPAQPETTDAPETPEKPDLDIQTSEEGKHSAWRELLSTVGILVTALLVALLIIAFVFRSYQVDGPSMENTLQNADKLIIWKVPRTWASITRHPYIPKRGDIIVFTESNLSRFGQTDTKQLIKRVIGLPGDKVVVNDGHYEIYNKQNPKGFDPDKTLPYGKNMPVTTGEGTYILHADEVFVSGDNRPDSLDSRAFGPIHANQIIGKLILRVFPVNKAKAF
ncbi:MAG TPA: signal peptidase I [Candidatus Saccharimonadales bacterium]|nr:signal peptidase I [Candidatus Saccharimonadales bacterium]